MATRALPGGGRLFVASRFRDRLFGLIGLRRLPPGSALIIPGVDSVHAAWMRFAIDVAFVDERGRVLRLVEGMRPFHVASCRGAAAVVETNAGEAVGLGYGVSGRRAGSSPPASAPASRGSPGACPS